MLVPPLKFTLTWPGAIDIYSITNFQSFENRGFLSAL